MVLSPDVAKGVVAQIRSLEREIAMGADRAALRSLLPAGTARNALDCALWDLEAKQAGRSVAELLNEPPLAPVATAITVSLDVPAAMAASARRYATFPLIKVKLSADDPEERLRAVRAAAPEAALIVDPNESWSIELLSGLQLVLAELRVAVVEQPLLAGEDETLRDLLPLVPICADESCHGVADLPRLAGCYRMINIKLDKTGGLTAALELLEAARAQGFTIMSGCMVSTSLSIAPALQIARHADLVDLDGPILLARDHEGGTAMAEGQLVPPQPGFWG